jgi:uncharacterized protein
MRKLLIIFLLVFTSEIYGQEIGYILNDDGSSAFQNRDLNEYGDRNTFYSDKEMDFCIHQTYYNNGQLKSEYCTFKNKLNGTWRTWYPDGNLEFLGCYFYGVPAGYSMTWYTDNRIESIGYYDTNIEDTIYGVTDSLKTKYLDCDTITYIDNEPPYDMTDSIICTDNVLKNGRWVEYYENGGLKSEKFFRHGIKVDTWKYYNIEGILIKEEIFDNNKMIKIIQK